MGTMLEAMKKAGLADKKQAEQIEYVERRALKREENEGEHLVQIRASGDMSDAAKQEKWLKGASKETTKPGSRVGTKQYFDRFKK